MIHQQNNQTEPLPPKTVLSYATTQPGVQFQEAYVIPSIANDYSGDVTQQLAGNSTKVNSTQNITQASSPSTTATMNNQTKKSSSQSVSVDSNKSNSLSSDLSMILGTIGLSAK